MILKGTKKYKADLLLGGNQGDVLATFQKTCELLNQRIGKLLCASCIYRTAAWGVTDQPDFLNAVITIQTTLSPELLLKETQQIEADLGRVRYKKWGARIIDIDILFMEKMVFQNHALNIPHLQIQHRRFTLAPLAEIKPDFIHPVLQQSMLDLYNTCADTLEAKKAFPKESLFDKSIMK